MRAFISLSLYAQRYSPESKSLFQSATTTSLRGSGDLQTDPAAIAIHKPATPGLGTESGCRPRDRHELLKKKKFIFFYLTALPLFVFITQFLTFFRRSVAALAAGKSYCRQPPATGKRFLFVAFLSALKKGICSPTYFLSQEAIRGWFARAPLTQQ